ncbi:LuxR C-terminal-related transcriptional regulator [Erwinia aphidicola]|uniref:LuxR C-terminal-related transcriptional regulator n=1 Tax=Erwinia aphidicola TaxID=68334 RepID=UPI001653F3E4
MSHIAILDSDAFCIKGIEEYFKLSEIHTIGCSSLVELDNKLQKYRIKVVISELVTDNDNLFACIDYFKHFQHRWPNIKLVIFTRLRDPALIAYVRKTLPRCELVFKYESAIALSLCITPSGLHQKTAEEELACHHKDILTAREFYLLRFLSEGRCHKDISRRLPLSIKTISYYKLKIMEKLKCKNMAEFQKKMNEFGVYYYQ